MSGIMNNYFYGKAGQGDYTVEQMPTTRRQLFFTTLKVRFSNMVGLNLIELLFLLPLIVWMYIGGSTAIAFFDDSTAAKMNGIDSPLYESFTAYDGYRTEYDLIGSAGEDLVLLNEQLSGVRHNLSEIRAGKEVIIEEPAVVEGGEPTKRALTEAELTASEEQLLQKISDTETYLKHGEDEAYMAELKSHVNETYGVYNNNRTAAMRSNLLTTLIIMIPFIMLAAVGKVGAAYVLRNWARDEHSFMWQDFKASVKTNWKQALVIGLINGLSFPVVYVAYDFYGTMAATGGWFYAIPQGLMIVLLILWWMLNEVIFTMMVTYEMNIKTLIRNSFLISVARLPIAFVILLGTVAVPLAILLLVPYLEISLLVLLVIYGVIGIAFIGFVQASFSNACFDKFLNPRIEGAKVNQGLQQEEEDEEEEELPAPEEKADRFWEHKTK